MELLTCLKVALSSSTHYENTSIQNILKISPPKTESFSDKNSNIFSYFCSNIDCGYSLEPPLRGGSNEYPQSMFLSTNKEDNVYPCKPQFYHIKMGFKGAKLYRHVFVMIISAKSAIPRFEALYFRFWVRL